jgi:hypothetical protein
VRRLAPTLLCVPLLACPKPEPSTDEAETETGEPSCLDADPPGEDLIIDSNDDVDELMLGECVPGKILISGGSVTDISGLAGLREVGKLEIRYNSTLPSLAGLEGLERIDSLIVVGNPLITTLPEFGALGVLGQVNISSNDKLTSLGSFPLATSISGLTIGANAMLPGIDGFAGLDQVTGDVALAGNPQFTDLAGLATLSVVGGDLAIEDNPELADFGMPLLTTVGGQLSILSNPNLSECLVDDLVAILDVGGATLVSGNKPEACT